MSLESLSDECNRACGGFWLRDAARLVRIARGQQLSNQEFRNLFSRAKLHAERNQPGRALNWFAAAFAVNDADAVARLRQDGTLRASRYDFKAEFPRTVIDGVLTAADSLDLRAETRAYLASSKALLGIAAHARRILDRLMSVARREPYSFAHSCLITMDLLFLREGFHDLDFGLDWSVEPYSKEDIAEGFSFLWSQIHQRLGLTRVRVGLWDPAGIYSGRYLGFLKDAAALRELVQAEVLVDTFGYSCVAAADAVEVYAPDAALEKSIRLGYIDEQMRQFRYVREAIQLDAVSLRDVGKQLHAMMTATNRIEYVAEMPARVRFLFPVVPALIEGILSKHLFAEELITVQNVLDDYGLTPGEAEGYEVKPGLSLGDIRRARRLCTIVAACVAIELARRKDDHDVLVNSVVPIYQRDDLIDEFLGLALEATATAEYRDLFRWPPTDPDAPTGFDLQYRPLLEAEGEWHVPMALLANSNLERAALMLTSRRPGTDHDLVGERLVKVFKDHGYAAAAEVKLRAGGVDLGEIDVAALIDDVLLVLECKNSLLPCNLFELRTSYKHCNEAAMQLDRLTVLLNEQTHRDVVLTRMGVGGNTVRRVVTGIAVSNRLFAGLRIGAHLVASVGTLSRFVTDGDFNLAGQLTRTRPEGPLTAVAVEEFFDGAHYERMFAAMLPAERVFDCGRRLRFRTYFLDFPTLGRQFGIDIDTPEAAEGS